MKLPAPIVESVPIGQLRPWQKNPRTAHAVDAIARSIKAFGYQAPIIVQKGTYRILAGHGRLEALKSMGATEVPVLVADITDDQAALYTVADNKLTELAGWDETLLQQLVQELQEKDLDLSLTGLDEASLEELLAADPLAGGPGGEDEIVEPIAEAVTRPGDLWHLGDHRIYCGDSTKPESYGAILEGRHAQLVFTDPPYGVDYKAQKFQLIANDELKGDRLMAFLRAAFQCMAAYSVHEAAFYIWHASSTREDFAWAMKAAGLIERQYLIWVKPSITLGHSDYHWQHEPCFYAGKEGRRPDFYGGRDQGTVWHLGMRRGGLLRYALGQGVLVSDGQREIYVTPTAPKHRKIRRIRLGEGQTAELAIEAPGADVWAVSRDALLEHPTQKPVELARRAILNSTPGAGALVLDPFLGSGSTLMAAELTGRWCRGIELSPQYCDVAIRRWQEHTGFKAANRTRTEISVD